MAFHAAIDAAIVGDNELVAAVTNRRIKVLAMHIQGDNTAALTAQLESGTGGNVRTGIMPIGATGWLTWDYNSEGWVTTEPGESLNLIITGAGGDIHGVVVYDVLAG